MEKKSIFKYKYTKLIFILLVLLFCMRAINIDQDLAPWGIAQYQPVDEGAYSYMAINEKTYGSINPHITYEGQDLELDIKENFITNIPGNFLSILSFHVFGNNYYGLRIPYVFWGLCVFVLFFLLIDKLRIIYGKGSKEEIIAEFALLTWYVVDFTFFNASRIAEPTMVRLVFVLLTALVYISFPENHTTKFFLLGVFATFSTFLVYITNVFLFLAIGLSILIGIKRNGIKNVIRELEWFILGSLSIFVVAEAYYYFVWHTEAVINTLRTIGGFASYSSSAELTVSSSEPFWKAVALVWAKIVGSNSFIYNLPVLFVFSVIQRKIWVLSKNDNRVMFLQLLIVCFICQTFISWDTVTRKIIVIFPLIIAVLYILYVNHTVDGSYDKNNKNCAKHSNCKTRGIDFLLWIFGFFNITIAILYRLYFYDGSNGDYDLITVAVLILLELLPLLVYLVIALTNNVTNEMGEYLSKLKMRAGCVVFVCMCLCNLALTYKYFWKAPSFTERDNMIELAELVDDKYVLGGGFQLGYTLYNDMKPILNTPENTIKLAGTIEEPLLIEYTSAECELEKYFRDVYYSKGDGDVYFIPKKEIERSFLAMGYKHNMCLYKVGTAEDYRDYRRAIDLEFRADWKKKQEALKTENEDKKEDDSDLKERNRIFDRCIFPYTVGNEYPIEGKEVAHIIGNIYTDITTPIYGNVYGDIHGDIDQPIHGNVYGDIYGDINAVVDLNVYGVVYGKDNGNVSGNISGKTLHDLDLEEEKGINIDNDFIIVSKDMNENIDSNIYGDIDYDIYGDINGFVFGNINGDVYGNVTGAVFGEVNGTIYGQQIGVLNGGFFLNDLAHIKILDREESA